MKWYHRYKIVLFIFLLIFCQNYIVHAGLPQWYEHYQNALKAIDAQNWQVALNNLLEAVKEKNEDKHKMRAFGAMFIEYYPHREIGICYYHLGNYDLASKELNLSLQQAATDRARDYLNRINQGNTPVVQPEVATVPTNRMENEEQPKDKTKDMEGTTIVGERLSIAVLPFESRGLSDEMTGMDLVDKLITGFVNCRRFKVIERAQLERILEEQKLGMTGILDASTAAQIGKGIGVDAVVLGSVTRSGHSISIDARFIDTETATIIMARDAYANQMSFQSISQMITELATKFKTDLPILKGYVINIDGNRLTIDIGRNKGLKKGIRCLVYREGESIVHPVSKEVIGKMIDEICEIQITYVFDAYSIGVITKEKKGTPKKLDKVITK